MARGLFSREIRCKVHRVLSTSGSTPAWSVFRSRGQSPPQLNLRFWADPGNAPKVNYYLPGDTNFDTALFKNIPIESKLVVQFRLETYNTFNHAEFNSLNNTATFATAASKSNPNPAQTDATFGRFNGANNPRYLQLALRVNF